MYENGEPSNMESELLHFLKNTIVKKIEML